MYSCTTICSAGYMLVKNSEGTPALICIYYKYKTYDSTFTTPTGVFWEYNSGSSSYELKD